MNYLAVAVVGAGTLSLVNLWLIVVMSRRLREQRWQLARLAPQRVSRPVVGPAPGTPVPDFSVTAVSGAVIAAADLRGERSLIGFFMPGCAPCHDQIPAFAALARSLPGGQGHALAIVSGGGRPPAQLPGDDAGRLTEELTQTGAAQVVCGSSAKAAAEALAVTGYPSFILLGADGRVEAGAHGIAGLGGIPALASSA
jgi:thiol-disulfide isomerase/thioredoxin